eukprot:2860095-Rhodomonas_salina.1
MVTGSVTWVMGMVAPEGSWAVVGTSSAIGLSLSRLVRVEDMNSPWAPLSTRTSAIISDALLRGT